MSLLKAKNKIVCFEIAIDENGISSIRVVKMQSMKGNSDFTIEGQYATLQEIPAKLLNKSVPALLLINGKGVITKNIGSSFISTTETDVLEAFFPNANAPDFIISSVNSERTTWASVFRFNNLVDVFQYFKEKGVFVTSVCCGSAYISVFKPYLSEKTDIIKTDTHQYLFIQNELTDIINSQQHSDVFNVGNDSITAEFLPIIGCGLHLLSGQEGGHGEHISAIKDNISNQFFYQKTTRLLSWGLSTLFLILLANYLVFTDLYRRTDSLQRILEQNSYMLMEFDSLNNEFSRKKDFLQQAGLLVKPRLTWYADQIAFSTPQLISLTVLNIHPMTKSQANEDEMIPSQGLIELFGKTPDPVMLHTWVDSLSKLSWIKQVDIINYSQDTRIGPATFELNVLIDNSNE